MELATKATRLNPTSADWYIAPPALSLFVLGRYDESIAFALRMPNATLDCPRCWRRGSRWPAIATAP